MELVVFPANSTVILQDEAQLVFTLLSVVLWQVFTFLYELSINFEINKNYIVLKYVNSVILILICIR